MSEPDKPATVPSVDDTVLLPCPFCGGDAYILESIYKSDSNTLYEYKAYCGQCNAECGSWERSRSEAAGDWNRRDGNPCREGCKIKRAVKEMMDSLTDDY